jgi:molybdopterin molybdotransferase
MISATEALSIIEHHIRPFGTITRSVDRSLGFTLAEDVRAEENLPAFDNAAMDGYAVRVEDCAVITATLRVVGEVAAGGSPSGVLRSGEAIAISTGAPIPSGCTAVVQQEWTTAPDSGTVTVNRPVATGHNVRGAGADIRSGSIVLRAGMTIRPQEIGLLFALGKLFVAVWRKPRVAILATGSELVEPDKFLAPGSVRNSNAHALAALVRQTGAEPRLCGIARDDRDELRAKLADALTSDLVITSGGISVGRHDLVRDVLRDCGVDIHFWKVNIKPGMPMLFGMRGATPVFALPGNPVSSHVTFFEFVRPAIDRLAGGVGEPLRRLTAKLAEPMTTSDGKRHFVRGILEQTAGGPVVRSTGPQVSNIQTSLTRAQCLIILPESKSGYAAGDTVEVELLP